ncbi:transglycosylase SLT domain-containing protein [Campylobacter sp.]|uniref:transglycosylase SLT domain-containing protein n=1 Tax=Campylobacter sp. TaxID=205 RepID=UPI002703D23D|nr:transglycosylase SLT domain-containing protein [Campylobacter sp.]
MRYLRIILLSIACFGFLSASTATKDGSDIQKKILKEFDIDAKFMKNSHYSSIKNSIKESKKREFVKILKDGYMYIPTLQKIIKESGIPESFLYLAMIESGFSNDVVSTKSAIGIWQFMAPTARLYGLRVDGYTDERKDPVASTVAATKYLKKLKDEFGKWYLAMMAYNCGNTKLRSAIKKAGTDDIATLLDAKKGYLPQETRQFVKKILTVAHIAKDESFIASKDASLITGAKGFDMVKIKVPGGTTLMEVGDSIGLSLKRMKEYNAHLKFVYTPPVDKPYYLYIPKNKEGMFKENFEVSKNRKFEIYTVGKNETLLAIAEKTGVNHKIIKEYNALSSNEIKANQKLVIPTEQNINYLAEYIVKSGDTLSEVVKKFDVAFEDLKDANSLMSSNSPIGAKLAASE